MTIVEAVNINADGSTVFDAYVHQHDLEPWTEPTRTPGSPHRPRQRLSQKWYRFAGTGAAVQILFVFFTSRSWLAGAPTFEEPGEFFLVDLSDFG